ncbi:MAG: PSD1 domain-containing protein [Pirellulaceae bacterium]|nr:PSD1 domain-containing protein [Pirellulaceae bacterium]
MQLRIATAVLVLAAHFVMVTAQGADSAKGFTPEQLDFFERQVRPLLAANCLSCHGPQKQEGGLRLDTREAVFKGGDSGPAAVAGNAKVSRLVQAIRREGDLQMPPSSPLRPEAMAALSRWVELGLPWPEGVPVKAGDAWKVHWAFQPVLKPAVPEVAGGESPLDKFVIAKLQESKLSHSPQADKRTLLRRAYFDLLGFPPTYEDVAEFEQDQSPDAWPRLIDRLLASPRYGERWGRHWLDVARYADNKGYVFFEEKNYPWAYTYRDYVIRSLNEDRPFDRFIVEQLAADKLDLGNDKRPLTAMGFLTLGPHYMGNVHDILDDRIDVVTRGLMGLTVTCARCHDHKYDPIPTADYYSLYGVLRSSSEPLVLPEFTPPPMEGEDYPKFTFELARRQQKLDAFVQEKHAAIVSGARTRGAEYLLAADAARKKPAVEDFMLLTDPGELNPAMIVRWQNYLEKTKSSPHGVWHPWHVLADIPAGQFSEKVPGVIVVLGKENTAINPLVMKGLAEKPLTSLHDVATVYGELLQRIDANWKEQLKQAAAKKEPPPIRLADNAEEELRQEIYAEGVPANIPLLFGWGFLTLLPDRAAQGVYQGLLKDVETWLMTAPAAPPRAMVLVDDEPYEPRIFLRGNPYRPGDTVSRQFVAVASKDRKPFMQGSGRLEMAKAIVDPANPLTARVLVNRAWLWHFGEGLVRTPSDFGLRSDPPSHPELLDYLASELLSNGWSLKKVHRQILLSATWQQQSLDRPEGLAVDPENRLLWKMNRQRLDFETTRDSLVAITAQLDSRLGGKSEDLLGGNFIPRRTMYSFIDRQDLPGIFSVFDFPSPNASSPQRDLTTVSPQALYLMNGPFLQQISERVLARGEIASVPDRAGRIDRIYQVLMQRQPEVAEQGLSDQFLGPSPTPTELERFIQALLMSNEFVFVD